MNKAIYFHIDELARDAVVAANLERVLKPHGVKVIYGNRNLSGRFHKYRFPKFGLYVFPSIDVFQASVPDPAKFPAPVIILPTESIETTARAGRHLHKYLGTNPQQSRPWTEMISAFCLWGPSSLRSIEDQSPSLLPRCHVVGHPRHDYRCQRNLSASYQPSNKIRVGIISRLNMLNRGSRIGMVESFYASRGDAYRQMYLSPGRDLEDRIYTESIDLRIMCELIQSLDTANFEISFRGHPKEDRTSWQNLVENRDVPFTLAPWDQPFMHWVQQVDYVVGPPSTSFYDCFVAGKKPICISDLVPHRSQHLIAGDDNENLILNYVSRPKSMEELLTMVSKRPEKQSSAITEGVAELLKEETNYPDSANSLDAFAKICLQVMDSSYVGNNSQLLPRIEYEIFSLGVNVLARLRRIRRNEGPEQSSSFLLTRQRRSFIRKLASVE